MEMFVIVQEDDSTTFILASFGGGRGTVTGSVGIFTGWLERVI